MGFNVLFGEYRVPWQTEAWETELSSTIGCWCKYSTSSLSREQPF